MSGHPSSGRSGGSSNNNGGSGGGVGPDGKMLNPHNPEFITKVPWYLGGNTENASLDHHSRQVSTSELSLSAADELFSKKAKLQAERQRMVGQVTAYKKGACKNCGATTHKEKDCFERPRSSRQSAYKLGVGIAADDVILDLKQHGKVSFDGKRDQWRGYNPEEHLELVRRHERVEQEQARLAAIAAKEAEEAAAAEKQANAEKDDQNQKKDDDDDSDWGSDADSDNEGSKKVAVQQHSGYVASDAEKNFQGFVVPQGGVGGHGMRTTSRHLRIREDTPKYLRNLDLESAYYDPKSRSMRMNPLPHLDPEHAPFAGDNFLRMSGDAVKLAESQILCWEMQAGGQDIDIVSNPSAAELVKRQHDEKKAQMAAEKKKALLDKYTDGKTNSTLDPRLRLGQTEAYVEYSRDGRVIRGPSLRSGGSVVTRSKYEEDVLLNNHTAVWGSYYCRATAEWGFACCHSTMKNSYCTGMKGREANDALTGGSQTFTRTNNSTNAPNIEKPQQTKLTKAEKELDEKRIYGEGAPEVAPEEMEHYLRKKPRAEDPMANLLGSDTLLE